MKIFSRIIFNMKISRYTVSMVAYTNYHSFTAVLCSYATAQFGSHFISFWGGILDFHIATSLCEPMHSLEDWLSGIKHTI